LVWTVHNEQPHEAAYVETDAALRRALAARAHVVHMHGQVAAECMAPPLGLAPLSVLVTPLGGFAGHYPDDIDQAAARRYFGIAPDAFLVVNISRIDSQKNQLGLLEAFARFHAVTPGARLVMIGPETQPAYGDKLRAFIAANHLGDAAIMVPGLSNESGLLIDAYHAADAFVLSSRHEPFGIVVLEAWCAGRAVVVSRVGGLQTLVRDGETGFFFDPDAPDAADQLAAHLTTLYRDPALRHKVGEAGRAEAAAHYDWTRIGARLEGIYQLAEESAARRWHGAHRKEGA